MCYFPDPGDVDLPYDDWLEDPDYEAELRRQEMESIPTQEEEDLRDCWTERDLEDARLENDLERLEDFDYEDYYDRLDSQADYFYDYLDHHD